MNEEKGLFQRGTQECLRLWFRDMSGRAHEAVHVRTRLSNVSEVTAVQICEEDELKLE